VIGGYNLTNLTLNFVEAYDPSTQVWAASPTMPTARAGMSAASSGGEIYVIGGDDASYPMLANVEQYTASTGTWNIVPSVPTPRTGLTVAAGHGKIYAIGGYYLLSGGGR